MLAYLGCCVTNAVLKRQHVQGDVHKILRNVSTPREKYQQAEHTAIPDCYVAQSLIRVDA